MRKFVCEHHVGTQGRHLRVGLQRTELSRQALSNGREYAYHHGPVLHSVVDSANKLDGKKQVAQGKEKMQKM